MSRVGWLLLQLEFHPSMIIHLTMPFSSKEELASFGMFDDCVPCLLDGSDLQAVHPRSTALLPPEFEWVDLVIYDDPILTVQHLGSCIDEDAHLSNSLDSPDIASY
jgi:hypothetical protein